MKTIDALKTTLSKHTTEYARGRAVRSALTPFATIDAVLDGLALTSAASHAERDAITFALVAEHQRASHPLWSSLLLIAYEPMLAHVRGRLLDKRDGESRIVLAFLEVLAKISLAHPPSLLALHLRHGTERGVFGTFAACREEPELVQLSEARKTPSSATPSARLEHDDATRRIARELETLFGDEAPRVLDVLLRARTGRESLVLLIAEWHPEMRARDRALAYERWQRVRRRALGHLEARFGPAACAEFAA